MRPDNFEQYNKTAPNHSHSNNTHNRPQFHNRKKEENGEKDEFSTAISWPIILAVIPTLGAFIGGSADAWSDFIMILLILYYVYKWITVPWSYYEGARTRRMIHQRSTTNKSSSSLIIEDELRRHELTGLAWVLVSPAIAGFSLQYSRFLFSNYDKYMSSFNVTVFVLAASVRPLIHVIDLLRERTALLQSEITINETEMEQLSTKLYHLEGELHNLRASFATKRDLGQVTNDIAPTLQQLSKAFQNREKKENDLRTWSEGRFGDIERKVQDFDQFICYSIEQDQQQQPQRALVSLLFLPINFAFYVVNRFTTILSPRSLLSSTRYHLTEGNIHKNYYGKKD